ncbi:hypothetical protein ABIB37_001856 [Agrococcus sp. UYP10]|uniref:hypothetical protein n=1 Tax=Agrococcus sp. UYP10 TaxID=1756355 RepID=UPI0033985401
MGIRYYAWPMPDAAIGDVLADPMTASNALDRETKDGWHAGLDKAWHDLQRYLLAPAERPTGMLAGCCPGEALPVRPAGLLLRGSVRDGPGGHHPYFGVVPSAYLPLVARDLALIDIDALERWVADPSSDSSWKGSPTYASSHLVELRELVSAWAAAGLGAMYCIR